MKKEVNNGDKKEKGLDKKILMLSHQLFPYVKNRIRVLERQGVLPKNMYQSSEIVDEVVLELYENHVDDQTDINQLKLIMFKGANDKIFSLLESEKWHKNSISTKLILEKELSQLEEHFTTDGDFDLIMNEELDDISYHQNNPSSHLLDSEEVQQDVISFLELNDKDYLKKEENKRNIRSMYRILPLQTSNVIDLYILGKLNLKDIANILETEIVEVKRIVQFVKENFKKQVI